MLREKGLKLDGVVELKVDEGILLRRIENRIAETRARGEPLRKDDDPEVLKTRLEAYRRQTAPLIDYYREKGALRPVDGMAPIDEVSAAIDWIFAKPAPQRTSTKPATPQKNTSESGCKSGRQGPEGQEGKGGQSLVPGRRRNVPPRRSGRPVAGPRGGPQRRPRRSPERLPKRPPAASVDGVNSVIGRG